MTRDTAREMAVQIVFGAAHSDAGAEMFLQDFLTEEHYASLAEENALYEEYPDEASSSYITKVVLGVFEHQSEIDPLIQKYSPAWNINRISGTALAVLRVAVFEILFMEDVPAGAAINSAVKIDKNYDDASTVAFVNGILGGIVRGEENA